MHSLVVWNMCDVCIRLHFLAVRHKARMLDKHKDYIKGAR